MSAKHEFIKELTVKNYCNALMNSEHAVCGHSWFGGCKFKAMVAINRLKNRAAEAMQHQHQYCNQRKYFWIIWRGLGNTIVLVGWLKCIIVVEVGMHVVYHRFFIDFDDDDVG